MPDFARRPQLSGVLLLMVAFLLFLLIGLPRSGTIGLITTGVTIVLFLGPLLAGGIALLAAEPEVE